MYSAEKWKKKEIETYRSAATVPGKDKILLTGQLQGALYFGIVISYVQGLHLLHQASAAYNYQIDLSAFPSGVYVLILETNKGKYAQKIVKLQYYVMWDVENRYLHRVSGEHSSQRSSLCMRPENAIR